MFSGMFELPCHTVSRKGIIQSIPEGPPSMQTTGRELTVSVRAL